MSNINIEVAVADAGAGVNVLADEVGKSAGYERLLMGVALVGGSAAGEPVIDIYVGPTRVFTVAGSATGLGIIRSSILGTRVRIPAGASLEARIVTAPTTNAIRLYLNMLP